MQAILAMKGGTIGQPSQSWMPPMMHPMMSAPMSTPSQMPAQSPMPAQMMPVPRPIGRPQTGSDEAKELMARVRAAQVRKYITKEKNEDEWPERKKTRIDDSDARAALSARRNSKAKSKK